MYHMPYFKEKDKMEVIQFMHRHPFIVLCGCDPSGRPVATQVPVLFKEKAGMMVLEGHIMRNTDHHLSFNKNSDVLAIFPGPNTYVSASLYTNPRQGSTWNYMTVQAHGRIRFLDEASLLRILKELTGHFENNPASPASFDLLPEEYINRMKTAIIAFEIEVSKVENVFKLSQNHERENYQSVIDKLSEQDDDARTIAREMEKRKDKLFEGK